jgi:outer membrane immunogenic protein
MKATLAILTSAMIGMAGAANAADLGSVYEPPPLEPIAPPETGWGGFFIGVHGGYGWANRDGCWDIFSTTVDCGGGDFDDTFDYGQDGWLAGAQGGYNWAFHPNFLVGVEVDASLADISGDLNPGDIDGGVGTWNWLATATAKAAWTNGPWMLYAEGGYAIGDFDFQGNSGCDFNANHTGPVAGVGAAVKLSPRVFFNVEYNHLWLGTETNPCTSFGFAPTAVETDAEMDVVKFGVNVILGN